MSLRDLRKNGLANGEACIIAHNVPLLAATPQLHEALVGYKDDKGKWVKGLKFNLYHECGMIKCCVNDEVAGKIGFITLDPFKALGEALEEVASLSGIEWRNPRGNR